MNTRRLATRISAAVIVSLFLGAPAVAEEEVMMRQFLKQQFQDDIHGRFWQDTLGMDPRYTDPAFDPGNPGIDLYRYRPDQRLYPIWNHLEYIVPFARSGNCGSLGYYASMCEELREIIEPNSSLGTLDWDDTEQEPEPRIVYQTTVVEMDAATKFMLSDMAHRIARIEKMAEAMYLKVMGEEFEEGEGRPSSEEAEGS